MEDRKLSPEESTTHSMAALLNRPGVVIPPDAQDDLRELLLKLFTTESRFRTALEEINAPGNHAHGCVQSCTAQACACGGDWSMRVARKALAGR